MLRLETQPGAVRKHASPARRRLAVHEVACVELNARLRGAHLERAATFRICHYGCKRHPAGALVEHPVVIVTVTAAELLIRFADPGAHCMWNPEIKRRARNRAQF